MTQEEKQLVLNDISSRLPYGVMMHVRYCDWSNDDEIKERDVELTCYNISYAYEDVWHFYKPYLRPMSSMTEEELKEFTGFASISNHRFFIGDSYFWYNTYEEEDWLNSHHFDYRRLIEKGLALEAPEGMYE